MKKPALFVVLLCWLVPPAAAHQCILDGGSATAIQVYNTCKADLANGTAGHGADDHADDHAAELARLQAENAVLKARLDDVRRRLLGLLGDL
ncbi:MAG: hypothetical protein VXW17_02555 [Pseudomonadota bacterium]|nr:hypothetical protein [Pseudomonadota bacterium]